MDGNECILEQAINISNSKLNDIKIINYIFR